MPNPRSLTIFFSAGEPSGDLHGANLIRALREKFPGINCVGYGGPQMQQAGCRLHFDLTSLAVMWLTRVLSNLHLFWRLAHDAADFFRRQRPDAVVLIDYPGFNWHIAKAAKKQGIPVFYYCPPQIWAWASWRVRKMRQRVDHVLCSLEFEEAWFRQRGCNATFIGHPFFDEVSRRPLDAEFIASQRAKSGPLVTILPGSRSQEVAHNLHWFLKAAQIVQEQTPQVRFAIASYNERQAETARQQAAESGLPIEVHVGRTPELMHLATCCMACSGSVSLELLYHLKPTVILYYVGRLHYEIGLRLINVKYITLVNLLAAETPFAKSPRPSESLDGSERTLFPEYCTFEDKSSQIAGHVTGWLRDEPARRRRADQLQELKTRVCRSGASRAAADYILRALAASDSQLPAPHFSAQSQTARSGL
jgi:lipid-A-disaccharide synthase